MHSMSPAEIAAEKLLRAYLRGRQLPKILHHAVVWIAQTRLSSGKLPVLDAALCANIDREARTPELPTVRSHVGGTTGD